MKFDKNGMNPAIKFGMDKNGIVLFHSYVWYTIKMQNRIGRQFLSTVWYIRTKLEWKYNIYILIIISYQLEK